MVLIIISFSKNAMYFSYNAQTKAATIRLKVHASARENMIHGFVEVAGEQLLKVSVNAAPENGKANKAIIKLLSKKLGLKQNQMEIIKGTTHIYKILEIRDVEYEYITIQFLKVL